MGPRTLDGSPASLQEGEALDDDTAPITDMVAVAPPVDAASKESFAEPSTLAVAGAGTGTGLAAIDENMVKRIADLEEQVKRLVTREGREE